MNIFVGNLAKDVSEQDLEKLFSSYGNVKSTKVIRDLFSGSSKGFGFVEMAVQSEAVTAINELNTKELKGQKITVNEARPKKTDSRGNRSRNDSRGGGRRSGGFSGGDRRRF
jgi:RNA recognition motif-containing protein